MRVAGCFVALLLLAGCEDELAAAPPPAFALSAEGVPAAVGAPATAGGPAVPGAPGTAAGAAPGGSPAAPGAPGAATFPGAPAATTPVPGAAAGAAVTPAAPLPPGAVTHKPVVTASSAVDPAKVATVPTPVPPPASVFVLPSRAASNLPSGSGAISGQVLDPAHLNVPVSQAWVTVVLATDASKVATVQTGVDGRFLVSGLQQAAYFGLAQRSGFSAAATPVYMTLSSGLPVISNATFALVKK